MARRKFRHSQGRQSSLSGSFQDYLANNPAPQTSRTELIRLIRGGEDTYLELKVKPLKFRKNHSGNRSTSEYRWWNNNFWR